MDSGVLIDAGSGGSRRSPWAAAFRRWFEALNAFLEKGFRIADVETGC